MNIKKIINSLGKSAVIRSFACVGRFQPPRVDTRNSERKNTGQYLQLMCMPRIYISFMACTGMYPNCDSSYFIRVVSVVILCKKNTTEMDRSIFEN